MKLPKISKASKDLVLSQWSKLSEENKKTTARQKNELFDEYLKFMLIIINNSSDKYNGTDQHCPSSKIDEVWHSHIVCTREYANFCSEFGKDGEFIHHTPAPENISSHKNYLRTLEKYSELGFGDATADYPDCWDAVESQNSSSSSASNGRRSGSASSSAKSGAKNTEAVTTTTTKAKAAADLDPPARGKRAAAAATPADKKAPAAKKSRAESSDDATVNRVQGKSKRHEDTLAKLIGFGIASATEPYSTLGKNGLWEFTGFERNVTFGPGSNTNAVLHCEKCNKIWEYQRGDAKGCVMCKHGNVKAVITTFGCC